MRFVTVLMSLLLIAAVVFPAAADTKEKPEGPVFQQTRGLLNCSNAIPIQCGVPVTGTNAGLTSNVLLYNGCAWNEGGGEVVYTLTLPGPNVWSFTATLSNYTNDPDVFILSACDEATNFGNPFCGHISTTVSMVPAGTYYIVVDQYGTAPTYPATWTLTVTCTETTPPCCPFPHNCYFLDFNQGPNGWYSRPCGSGPVPWAWGMPVGSVPTVACNGVPRTNVLITNLAGNYPNSKGEAAVVGPFTITPDCKCLELCHYYYMETWDGGNVRVSTDGGTTWTRIAPAGGYPGVVYSGATSIQCLTPSEPCFNGNSTTFVRHCFDLTQYVGQTIHVGFFFGSDSSVNYRGWAIKWLKIGGAEPSPVEDGSWGTIKALYR
ncbi:MAG: hypothetical protein FJY74_07155 [Candidatus Eisenbacteria bacterium]|nr:hypothetical protein [Candidatus Eisenbacteria bacterium]